MYSCVFVYAPDGSMPAAHFFNSIEEALEFTQGIRDLQDGTKTCIPVGVGEIILPSEYSIPM